MKSELKTVDRYKHMRDGIEKRFHRVMIKTDKKKLFIPILLNA